MAKDIMLRKSMTGRFMGQLCNIYNCYFTFFEGSHCLHGRFKMAGFPMGYEHYMKNLIDLVCYCVRFSFYFYSLNKITSKQFKIIPY